MARSAFIQVHFGKQIHSFRDQITQIMKARKTKSVDLLSFKIAMAQCDVPDIAMSKVCDMLKNDRDCIEFGTYMAHIPFLVYLSHMNPSGCQKYLSTIYTSLRR